MYMYRIHARICMVKIRKIGYRKEESMTKKRKMKLESELASLLDVEKELLSEGKQLSMAYYAMKNRVLRELEAA